MLTRPAEAGCDSPLPRSTIVLKTTGAMKRNGRGYPGEAGKRKAQQSPSAAPAAFQALQADNAVRQDFRP